MMGGTFISLYSGAGGLDMGFIAAGFTPVFSNEINRNAAATHKAMIEAMHMDGCVETCGDLSDHMHEIPDKADLIIGGPPCQGFSIMGNMNPSDPRSWVVAYNRSLMNGGPVAMPLHLVSVGSASRKPPPFRRSPNGCPGLVRILQCIGR